MSVNQPMLTSKASDVDREDDFKESEIQAKLQIKINGEALYDDGSSNTSSSNSDTNNRCSCKSGCDCSCNSSCKSKGSERASWGGKLEFIFTCIGYAVGLGNVWRFPYLCYRNGGGAFLIPYTIMLAVVGIPLFYIELVLGQFSSQGPIAIWRLNPILRGLGYAMVMVDFFIGLYYNVVISHVLMYLVSSLTSTLPWTTCGNDWNTKHCLEFNYVSDSDKGVKIGNISNMALTNTTAATIVLNGSTNMSHSSLTTPSEEFFKYYILQQTESIDDFGSLNWKLVVTLAAAWTIVCFCLIRGVKSLGKVVYFTAIFPYIMLTILLVRGLTLEGASTGILYYVKPDFSRLADARVWNDAATQIFFSLGTGTGGLIAMSSFSKFKNNCYRDALVVSIINCATSIYAGFVIFSVLGFMAVEKGVDVADVATKGPGLAFVVYPEALSRMPVAPMWAIFFFIMMATLGFGSQFSIAECFLSAITDVYPALYAKKRSMIFRVVAIVICFLLGLPMVFGGGIFLLNLVDYSVSGFPLLFIGLIECVAISWIYGLDKFSEDISMMIGYEPKKYWKFCWKFLTPLVILALVIFNMIFYDPPIQDGGAGIYPDRWLAVGWLISMAPLVVIIGWALYYYCKNGGFKLLKERSQPLPDWGPAHPENRSDSSRYVQSVYTDKKETLTYGQLLGSNTSDSSVCTVQSNLSDISSSSPPQYQIVCINEIADGESTI